MEISLPYLAGFFDGEGSLGIYFNGPRKGCTLRVQLTQNVHPLTTALLEACRERWGGSMTVMNRNRRRPAWNFQVSAGPGVAMLRELRPWLILKAEQADVALEWWAARPVTRLRSPDGRVLPFPPEVAEIDRLAEARLKSIKWDLDAATPSDVGAVEIHITQQPILSIKNG